jgi:hypothetical protein
MNNSMLSKYYLEYLRNKTNNKNLVSQNLNEIEIQTIYKNNNISEFDMYLYITAYDFIKDSLNCNNITLNEGIISKKNLYKNILIDLFYCNIPSQIILTYPIAIVFGIKQESYLGDNIKDLTKKDLYN